MANADHIPAADEVLAEKYRIERVLGQGGMGIVVAAMHLQLEERVAIKFLLPELAHDPALVTRFLREGRSAIKIRSEHVVRVLDVGTLPGGTPYMVMEYLEGKNFEELLEHQGRVPVELAVDHLLQATEALAEAHALGMIHRDLKPANLFLAHRADGSPCVKILDFGITKVIDGKGAVDFEATSSSIVMGSPRYMSPEQMRSAPAIDARADIWGLGVILHELIAGESPFDGATMPDLLAAILQDPPTPLRRLRPEVPAGVEAAVAKCLEKDPAGRFADVAELTQALAPYGSNSARVSADRVSRVIRPRAPSDTSTSAPIVRSAIPSVGDFRPEPATGGSLTVSATAEVLEASPPPARFNARTVALWAGGIFFAGTMLLAIFDTRGTAPVRSQGAASESPPITAVSPPPRDSETALPTTDAVSPPAAAPLETASATTTASARSKPAPTAPRSKRRAVPSTSSAPPAPETPNDADLFDGRK
jgi:eukaryotic-like serine/threonine-protein kinase